MARGGKRPDKRQNPLGDARERLAEGRYRDTRHVTDRGGERFINRLEIRQVIETGWHEKRKDEFKPEWQAWNYAIRGRTIEGRELRVAVSFDEEDYLLFITAIDLGRGPMGDRGERNG